MSSTSSPFKFECGDEVKDLVTGFKGIVVSRAEFFNRCIRYSVQPTTLKDGAPQDSQGFDEEQLALIKSAKIIPPEIAAKAARDERTGGPPRAMPSRPKAPARRR